jgi:hypothetical protein
VVEAVRVEAQGSPPASFLHRAAALFPDKSAQTAMETVGVDRLAAVRAAVDLVRQHDHLTERCLRPGRSSPRH